MPIALLVLQSPLYRIIRVGGVITNLQRYVLLGAIIQEKSFERYSLRTIVWHIQNFTVVRSKTVYHNNRESITTIISFNVFSWTIIVLSRGKRTLRCIFTFFNNEILSSIITQQVGTYEIFNQMVSNHISADCADHSKAPASITGDLGSCRSMENTLRRVA